MKKYYLLFAVAALFSGCLTPYRIESDIAKCQSGDKEACASAAGYWRVMENAELCGKNASERVCLYVSCVYQKIGEMETARKARLKICDMAQSLQRYGGKVSCILEQNEELAKTPANCDEILD